MDNLLPATIADIDVAMHILSLDGDILEPLTNIGDGQKNFARNLDVGNLLEPVGIFLFTDCIADGLQFLFDIAGRIDHLVESLLVLNRLTDETYQEAVPQGLKSFALHRQFVRSTDEQFERQMQELVAIEIDLLVDDRKQRVLDGRTRLPDFVEKHHIGRGQIAINTTLIDIVHLETLDADGTEDLVGCGEA